MMRFQIFFKVKKKVLKITFIYRGENTQNCYCNFQEEFFLVKVAKMPVIFKAWSCPFACQTVSRSRHMPTRVLNYCTWDYFKSWHLQFSENNHLQVHSLLPNLQCDDCLGRSLKHACCAMLLRINQVFCVSYVMTLPRILGSIPAEL